MNTKHLSITSNGSVYVGRQIGRLNPFKNSQVQIDAVVKISVIKDTGEIPRQLIYKQKGLVKAILGLAELVSFFDSAISQKSPTMTLRPNVCVQTSQAAFSFPVPSSKKQAQSLVAKMITLASENSNITFDSSIAEHLFLIANPNNFEYIPGETPSLRSHMQSKYN